MSRENLELVRSIYDAVTQRDSVSPFEIYSEDIVWDWSGVKRAALYEKSVYTGHEGIRAAWRESLDVFGAVDFDVVELIDGGDRVLAEIHERATGRSSGAPVEAVHFAVWTLANGKVVRLEIFDDREPALDAAGLR